MTARTETPKQRKWRLAQKRAYYAENRERELAQKRAYYAENRGRQLAQRRAYREANPEKVRESMRKYREANPEKVRESMRKYDRIYRGMPTPTRPEPAGCEACHKPPSGRYKSLCLEHNHTTGAFRGWLCHRCNSALGLLGDSAQGVLQLLAFLIRNDEGLV